MKLVITLVIVLCIAVVVALAVTSWADHNQFIAIFGVHPGDNSAQIAVNAHMRTLVEESCGTAKQLQVFPGDNYGLQVTHNANMHRLEHAQEIIYEYNYTVPDSVDKFLNRAPWPQDAKYADLRCE
jgi:hypothetical protein